MTDIDGKLLDILNEANTGAYGIDQVVMQIKAVYAEAISKAMHPDHTLQASDDYWKGWEALRADIRETFGIVETKP